jgi:hypothetical protein
MSENEQSGSLKSCLEESNNPRMQNYVKILDTPGISAMEWIHRTQEELMDGIVYLEKLKNVFSMNMRELDAAARIVAKNREEEEVDTESTTTINIDVPVQDAPPPPAPTPATTEAPVPKKRATKTKPASEKEEKPKKKKTKAVVKEEA